MINLDGWRFENLAGTPFLINDPAQFSYPGGYTLLARSSEYEDNGDALNFRKRTFSETIGRN